MLVNDIAGEQESWNILLLAIWQVATGKANMEFKRTRQWTAILNLSYAMLNAAQAQAWDRLVKLEQERHSRINRFFTHVNELDEVLEITEGTHKILAIDKEILAISKRQRVTGNHRPGLSRTGNSLNIDVIKRV